MKTAYWFTIIYTVLFIIVCIGVNDTLADPQQFISIGQFLILSFIVLVLSSLGGSHRSLVFGSGASMIFLFIMGSVTTDLPEITTKTIAAIIALITATILQIVIAYGIATKRINPYEAFKKRPDDYDKKRFSKRH